MVVNLAIVGGGNGGTSILKAFCNIDNYNIIGICDNNPEAKGIRLARSKGIRVFQDLDQLFQQPKIDVIIEATGNDKVKEAINQKKPKQAVVVDSQIASIMMNLIESHEEMIRKLHNEKEAFKTSAPLLIKTYESGVIYFTTDLECYDFVLKKDLDIPGVQVGGRIVEGGFVSKCLQTKKEVIGTVPQQTYGIRLKIWVRPVLSDDMQKVTGTCGVFIPVVHPIARAFNDFAPPLAQAFPEGAVIIATDLEKITHRQGSKKFDIDFLKVNTKLRENDAAPRSIRARAPVVLNVDARAFGTPCQIISVPLFDDESKDTVGAFGLIFPRVLAHSLQEMAMKLTEGTKKMASIMQEIEASANEINVNEENLAESVQEIQKISEQINKILNFIRTVADQTKILGINASIEAARAGDLGRGFGVVANEIRNLSDTSKETAKQIQKLTSEIGEKIALVSKVSVSSAKQTQEQAAATQEVTAFVTEINILAEKLAQLAGSL